MAESGITSTIDSDAKAAARFEEWEWQDPFPEISPALLNSADIHAYVETTGALFPYNPSDRKSAAIGLHVGAVAATYDFKSESMKYTNLQEGNHIELAENSLVYIETLETIRLPHYLAMRFNLAIHLIHRGLLLGTGPMVDPGYCGKLLIPVHNFTNKPKKFFYRDRLIWAEFTKVSPHEDWTTKHSHDETSSTFVSFKKNMLGKHPRKFLLATGENEQLYTAIPATLQKYEETLREYKEEIEYIEKKMNRFRNISISSAVGATFTLVITINALIAATWTIIHDANEASNAATRAIEEVRTQYRIADESAPLPDRTRLHDRISDLHYDLNRLKAEQRAIEEEIRQMEQKQQSKITESRADDTPTSEPEK